MIIVISNPSPLKNEHIHIRQLFDEGLELFHLRKKDLSESEIRFFIEAIPIANLPKVVIHSHYHLAVEYGLRGIHVPSSFTDNHNSRHLSVSFHSLHEIDRFKAHFKYGFLSPVFDSISKLAYKSNFNLTEVQQFLYFQKNKIIALGGIDEDKIAKIKDCNFSGIALLGAIWQNSKPCEKFLQIKKKWQS